MCFGGSKKEEQKEDKGNVDLIPERKIIMVGAMAVGKSAIIH